MRATLMSRSRAARLLGLLALIAALVVSSLVRHSTPDDAEQYGPIVERADADGWATGRTLEASIGDARFVEGAITASDGHSVATNGRWLVVDVTAACMLETCLVQNIALVVGDVEFSATEMLGYDSIGGTVLPARIASEGTVAFELPDDIAERRGSSRAELRVSSSFDARLDSQLRFILDMTELLTVDEFTVSRPVQVAVR